jgi:hypothetical protein
MERPNWMSKLLEQGYTAYSQAGSLASQKIVARLAGLRLVKVEVQGTRRKIVVLDSDQFQRWVEANYPPVDPVATAALPARSQNIARRRSSKAGQTTHNVQPVLLKWFEPDPGAPLAQLTRQNGLVGLTSDRLAGLSLPQPWWLLAVENWESFYRLDYPESSTLIVAVYLGGHVAEVTLTALADLTPPPERALHYGDYDWTGLAIFQRVQAVLPTATLYIPANIETLFQRHGNRKLIEDQAANARPSYTHSDCRAIVELIAQYNAGLEQEIVSQPTEADFTETH